MNLLILLLQLLLWWEELSTWQTWKCLARWSAWEGTKEAVGDSIVSILAFSRSFCFSIWDIKLAIGLVPPVPCSESRGGGEGWGGCKDSKSTENGVLGLIYSCRCKGLLKLQILNWKMVVIAKAVFLQAWPEKFCISFN